MKKFLVTLYRASIGGFLYFIAPVLGFDRRFLRGRHFEEHISGWRMLGRAVLMQKILGFNRSCRFPISHMNVCQNGTRLKFHPDDFNNLWHYGCYFQTHGGDIEIGKGTYIAPNVGLITSNHDPFDPERHLPGASIKLGCKCWIGMNAVILPGVELGDHTVVAAGAVVTKSFPSGRIILGGVPAKVIKELPDE